MNDFDSFYIICLIIPFLLIGLIFLMHRFKDAFSDRKTFRLIAWNLLLTAFLGFLVLAIGETYYRFYYDTTDSFALSKSSTRWFKRHYKLNNLSARDNIDYQLKIQKGKRRITIVGDSFTTGHGIKDVDDRFGNILRTQFPNLEVHIMAANGLNSFDELNLLKKLDSDRYEFDIVLLAYCLNDVDYLLNQSQKIYDRIYAFSENLNYLQRESYFINTVSFRWFASNDPNFMSYSNFVMEAYKGGKWQQQKSQLSQLKNFIVQRSNYFGVINFPFLQVEKEEYAYREVHQLLKQFWTDENVPQLDLLDAYDDLLGTELTVNKYDAHPNKFAHRLAADALAKFIVRGPSD